MISESRKIELELRNEEIYQKHLDKVSNSDLSKEYELDPKTIQAIITQEKKRATRRKPRNLMCNIGLDYVQMRQA